VGPARAAGAPHRDAGSREVRRRWGVVGFHREGVDKIPFRHDVGHERFLLQMIGGGMPHAQVMRAIELLGTEVAPAVRRALSG